MYNKQLINIMNHAIQFLTMAGCHNCEAAKSILNEVLPDFPSTEIKDIDIATPAGRELAGKYGVISSPGIVIDGELFSTGGVSQDKLVEKLKSLK